MADIPPEERKRLHARYGEVFDRIDKLELALKRGTTDRLKVQDELAQLRNEQLELAEFVIAHEQTNATSLEAVIEDRPQQFVVREIQIVGLVEQRGRLVSIDQPH